MIELDGHVLDLPDKFSTLRPHQEDAILEVAEKLQRSKVVFLDAPTGAGKTLIGECVRQLRQARDEITNGLYLCTTLTLQDQFLEDFDYSRLIKGRSNYGTADYPERFSLRGERHLNAGHCDKKGIAADLVPYCDTCDSNPPDSRLDLPFALHCSHCHPWQSCPYEIAKSEALRSQLAVANTAYLLSEANYVGTFGSRLDKDGMAHYAYDQFIIDEADTLEDVLMGHIQLNLSVRQVKALGIGVPKKVTVLDSWIEWATEAVEEAKRHHSVAQEQIAEFEYHDEDVPTSVRNEAKSWERTLSSVAYVKKALEDDGDNWVFDGHNKGEVVFRPVEIGHYARQRLWKHAPSFLLMSATLISPEQMGDELGLLNHEWDAVTVDSNFDPVRRPVYIRPCASVTNKTKDEAYPKLAVEIENILDDHRDERILIHTVSYALTEFLHSALVKTQHGHRILRYSSSAEREKILEEYKRTYAAVLLAPSFDRGVDLPNDDCRVIVVAKVPFPNLGDKQVSQRFYGTPGGRSWYATKTVRSMIQMTGRGMRHANDSVTSYIIDDQFRTNIWRNSITRNKLPEWWTKAVKWETPRRQ